MRRTLVAATLLLPAAAPAMFAQATDTARTAAQPSPARRFTGRMLAGYMGVIPGVLAGGAAGAWIERHAVTLLPGLIGLASGSDGSWPIVLAPPLLAPMASAIALDRC